MTIDWPEYFFVFFILLWFGLKLPKYMSSAKFLLGLRTRENTDVFNTFNKIKLVFT